MSVRARIKIFDLRDSPWVDGPGRTILETAAHIDSTRFYFLAGGFTTAEGADNTYLDTARRRDMEIVEIIEKRTFDYNIVKQIRDIVLDCKIDILHTHELRSNLYGWLATRGTNVKITATSHGWITNTWKEKAYKAIDKRLLAKLDFVTTVSEKIRDELIVSGVRQNRVRFLQNALVLEKFARRGRRDRFRAQHDLSATDIVVAKIGRLSPEKNQISVIRAAAKLSSQIPNLRLLILGIGPDDARLKEEVSHLGAQHNVLFLGYQEDMLSVYEACDLVIQSSFTEGMPNVLLEALAMQVPVIATDVGGTRQIIESGVTGTLLASAGVNDLATAIHEFISNRDKHEKMTDAGRARILQNFDFSARTRVLESVYEALVYTRSPAAKSDRAAQR